MTRPDPYLDADRLYVLSNAVPAIAGHLGITLDREGRAIAPPDGASLVEAVAALTYARHTTETHRRWEDLGPRRRADWIATAEAVLRLTAATNGAEPLPPS